ncbi:MAG: sulfatase [Planctomycetaceae bacterium]|nr:sulfatase [Planctomycetaceae bacterium]
MRILYLDIDTLRPDHLACYGYLRNTSPNIDRIAAQGVRYDHCYVSDAPCLPSRAAMFTGRFGIHSGVVNHGGLAADPFPIGRDRNFNTQGQHPGLISALRRTGLHPVSFSPFAERHSAWWFYEGWREMTNPGKCGGESADEIVPAAMRWLGENARRDDWMVHINIWDPHTPYRSPEDFGNPFAGLPIDGWYSEDLRRRQWESFGPGGPQDPGGGWGLFDFSRYARMCNQIASMDDYRTWIDGYDCGIAYADAWCGRVLNLLADQGVLDETVVVITSDHGEAFGELGVIGDHATADMATSRVPMIVRWPGLPGGRVDAGLYNQCDIGATLVELAGGQTPAHWDGRSFAGEFKSGRRGGRDTVVMSQCCWSCQRSVRWDDWLYIRTYHSGLKNLPERMLFNVAADPHELHDLATQRADLVARGQTLLDQWHDQMMSTSQGHVDPLQTVLAEGGPYHTRPHLERYCQRLRETGRSHHADFLQRHPTGLV